MTARSEEVAAGLDEVRHRVLAACEEVDRDPDDVRLVVVTKFFPASDVRILAALGVRDVAENRHQEAEEKAAACTDLGLTWHFVGGLQSNKAAAVPAWADVVQSVDRPKLVAPLTRGAARRGSPLPVTIQVDLDPSTAHHRSGCLPEHVAPLAARIAEEDRLLLRGVMAVAPLGADPGPAFDRLAAVHHDLLAEHPDATWRSAGMSADLEAAVARGATHVRVGSAVLGSRPLVQ